MQIAFTTSGLKFNGHSIKTSSIGGSETALVCVARELAKLGHDVRVYCECDQPGVYDDVQYYSHKQFQLQNAFNNLDVHISSRWPEFLAMKVPAGLRVLWCHDTCPTGEDAKTWMAPLFQSDMVMVLSEYHRDNYLAELPDLEPHLWKTSNGVDLDFIKENLTPKVPQKLIYTSRPERGLIHLLQHVMPKLAETHPDARLYHCAYPMSGSMQISPELQALYAECERLSKSLPNVIGMGSLTKEQLYKHISSAELLLYPTSFPEISCITAMEAQACGTPMITTDGFALSETLGDDSGMKIANGPADPSYLDSFVEITREWLDSSECREDAAKAGQQFIEDKGYTWDRVAKSWETEFTRRLADRTSSKRKQVVQNLIRNNDIQPAKLFLDKYPCDVEVPETYDDTVIPSEDLVDEFRRAIVGRFTQGVELLKYVGVHPKKVLEYGAGSISPGIALSRWLPESEITIMAKDDDSFAQLEGHLLSGSYGNVTLLKHTDSPTDEFDVMVLHEYLDDVANPQSKVKYLQNRFLKKNGVVVAYTRFGSESSVFRDHAPSREWNFDIRDLQDMFGEGRDFNATFSSTGSGGKVRTNAAGELLGHWVTVFRNNPDVRKIDLQGKFRRTRPYQSVAVCMIAGNEEDWISGSIKSALPVADRVVVALNQTGDDTEEICRNLGAEVRHCEFNNFSQVRNVSRDDVEEDWILWMDADERLVNQDQIRKYLFGAIFNGFAIRQNHLMLDLPGTYDLPIRLFRNKPEYRFVGYIHEHCEDTSKADFDDPIAPTLALPDVDIAHYGYLNEKVRRYKCSARNLQLLLRDVQDNGFNGRVLTWVLVIRDYLNIVKWSFEKSQDKEVSHGSFEHGCLNAAVATFINHFESTGHRYEDLARPMYEEALEVLSKSGLPYGSSSHPPFEVGLALFGAIGGLEDKNIAPESKWFRDVEEYERFIHRQGDMLSLSLGIRPQPLTEPWEAEKTDEPPHLELLSQGLNVVERSV